MNHTPKLMVSSAVPAFAQGIMAISKGASFISGFPASVYGDPEESKDIADVPETTEVRDVTRLCVDGG